MDWDFWNRWAYPEQYTDESASQPDDGDDSAEVFDQAADDQAAMEAGEM